MSPSDVTDRLAQLRGDFDRSFTEPARQHDVEYAELLAIRAGGRPYALRLSQASGVHSDRPVTPLPGPQAALLGVAGFSGAIVPVYDLAALLGHPVPERPRWLVLAAGSPPLALAFHELDGHVRVPTSVIVGEAGRPRRARGPARHGAPAGRHPADRRPAVGASRRAPTDRTHHDPLRGTVTAMAKRTFGSKLAFGFGLTVALTLVMGTASVIALAVVVDAKDDAIDMAVNDLVSAEHLTTKAESRISDYRGYLLNGNQEYLDATNADRERVPRPGRAAARHADRPDGPQPARAPSPTPRRSTPRRWHRSSSSARRSRTCATSRQLNATDGRPAAPGAAGLDRRADRPGYAPTWRPPARTSTDPGHPGDRADHRAGPARHGLRQRSSPGGSAGTCAARSAPRSATSRARRRSWRRPPRSRPPAAGTRPAR